MGSDSKDENRNHGCEFDLGWFKDVHINLPAVKRRADTLATRRTVKNDWQVGWLLKAVVCLDLTTLSGDDTPGNVSRLCYKAIQPLRTDLLAKHKIDKEVVSVAAVCVYPARIQDCAKILKKSNSTVVIASVASAFPSGQSFLDVKLEEIRQAVANGANEIDVVINRAYALTGDWKGLYNELRYMKQECGKSYMKTIIAVGELGSLTNVYKASMVAMMAGSDFIKTSTGKEAVNAILPVGIVMVRAIRDYFQRTSYKVGFKAAGGLRNAKDACTWLSLMKEELGNEWTKPHLFRIGASALLTDIERQLFHCAYKRYAATYEMPLA